MPEKQDERINTIIHEIKKLTQDGQSSIATIQAGGLALTVLNDTVGGSHPL